MAMRYMKLSNCGNGGSKGRDDDVEIAATVLLLQTKRHKTYKRDREGANKMLNAQYFVERPLYNSDHFRRSIADSLDEHLQMGESTVLETLKRFVRTIVNVFGEEWIRPPSEVELQHILKVNEARGFPGMIGSIDCMHWEWSSCPTALHGMYKGHKGKATVILEAVVTEDLRIAISSNMNDNLIIQP
ncbi:hypothetical protein EJB05_16704, partial [Eragrostis curvula]